VDRTLSLLYTSSQSHGLPHQLTRNLAILARQHRHRAVRLRKAQLAASPVWKPHLPPNDPAYSVPRSPPGKEARAENKEAKRARQRRMDDEAWGALGESVRLAEGRAGVSLGRVPEKPSRR
jgi:hypothetical protein